MDFNFPLPQVIGLNAGTQHDGAVLGNVIHSEFNALKLFSKYHILKYAVLYGTVLTTTDEAWQDITEELNAAESQGLFDPGDVMDPPPQYNFTALYLAVEEGITSFSFNCTTAGVGTFAFVVEYNSPTGYITLPGAVLSSNFLKTTGASTVTFSTVPTDWQEDFIGIPTIPRERWLRIRIVSGTVTTTPLVEGGWAGSAVVTPDVTPGDSQPPFLNPYKPSIPAADGDTLYCSSDFKPTMLKFSYTQPLVGAEVEFSYALADGSFAPLENFTDLSEGFTATNEIDFEKYTFTATDATAVAVADEGLVGNCYVEAYATTPPTATTDRWALALSDSPDLPPTNSWGIFVTFASGVPTFEVQVNNVTVYTTPVDWEYSDQIQVWRYNGFMYFKTGGRTLPAGTFPVDDNVILHPLVFEMDDATEVTDMTFVDWSSSRKAAPIELTFTTAQNITVGTTPTTSLYPAYYYITFQTPSDMALLTALQSPTEEAGYVIAATTVGDPTQPVVLMTEQYIGVDNPDNTLFVTGSQTTFRYSNLVLADWENVDFTFMGFLCIIKNLGGYTSKILSFEKVGDALAVYSTSVDVKVGVTDIAILQFFGDDDITVGLPSEISIST